MVEMLRDEDVDVRRIAVETLGKLAGANPELVTVALPHVVEALRDGEVAVRCVAVAAIGQLAGASPATTAKALPCLVEALQNGDGDGGVAEELPPVLSALIDGDVDLRRIVVAAIGQLASASMATDADAQLHLG